MNMKKNHFITPVMLIIFAAIFMLTSCANDSDNNESGSNVATLTSVKFGVETASLGTPANAYADAIAGSVTLLQQTVNVTAVPTNNRAALEYARVAAGAALNEASFGSTTTFTFATGDQLAVKVTAENGTAKLYYKIAVTLTDVVLSTLTVGGNNVTLPNSAASWQQAATGSVVIPYAETEQPAQGLVIAATAQPQGAVIAYGQAEGDATPTFSNNTSIRFTDGEFLYIRVTASGRSSYYKIRINFQNGPSAQAPVITKQPQGGIKSPYDSVTLSVTAVVSDGGSLSYQWYKAASPSDTPLPISGAVSREYSFSAADTSTYYWVDVKNTLGYTSATTRSALVGIIIQIETLPDNWTDKVTIRNTSAPVYGFNLPGGEVFGNYDRIKFTLKFDAASTNLNNRRMQAWGNYNYDSWTDVYYHPPMSNATPNGLLLSNASEKNYTSGNWVNYTIVLDNRDALTTASAIKAAEGVILLAFAPIPPNGGTGTTIFYVKGITLENADGSKVVKALNPKDPLLFYGVNSATAYVTQNESDVVTRVLDESGN